MMMASQEFTGVIFAWDVVARKEIALNAIERLMFIEMKKPGLVVALVLCGLSWLLLPPLNAGTALDIGVYWDAVQRWGNGLSAYQSGIHLQFKYSPFTTWVFERVLGGVSLPEAYRIYPWVMVPIWMGLFYPLLRAFPFWGIAAFAICAPAIAEELKLGQINAIALAMLAITASARPALRWKQASLVGVALAIGIGFKLFLALWLPMMLIRREWKALLCFTVALFALNFGVVGFRLGWLATLQENWEWLSHLWSSSEDLLASRYNTSWIGVMSKTGLAPFLVKMIWVVLVVGWLGGIYRYRAMLTREVSAALAYTGLAILGLNPLVWSYWIWLAIPAFAWLWLHSSRAMITRKNYRSLVLATVALWVVAWSHHSRFNRDGAMALTVVWASALLVIRFEWIRHLENDGHRADWLPRTPSSIGRTIDKV